MAWWEEYVEHVQHLCWEKEQIPIGGFEQALDIVYDARENGGPKAAALTLEEEFGIDPAVFSDRFS